MSMATDRPLVPESRKRRKRTPKATTTFTLPANDQRPRYELLIDLLRQQIDTGVLKPGDPVPSVRQLISDLGVSHTTVTRALRALVQDGTLDTKVGSGTRVAVRRQKKAIGILGLSKYTEMTKSAFMMHSLNLLQRRVLETGRTLIYRHINAENNFQNEVDELSQVDGLVMVGHFPANASHMLSAAMPLRIPIVSLSSQDTGQFPVFTSDDSHDSARLIRYLASLGHKRIATLWMDLPSYLPSAKQRVNCTKEALIELGLPHGDELFLLGSAQDQIDALLKLEPRPTTIFFASGIHRFPVIFEALKDSPLDPRTQTLFAGYDENLWNQFGPAGIEHVRIDQPLTELVNLAFDSLEKMIDLPAGKKPSITSQTRPSRIVHVKANGDATPVNV